MSFVEDMDEIVETAIKAAQDDFIFEYDFTGDTHNVISDDYRISMYSEVEESCGEWEIYAEVKNAQNDTIDTFFDSGDSLDEISSGLFEKIFDNFFENNILTYFVSKDDE